MGREGIARRLFPPPKEARVARTRSKGRPPGWKWRDTAPAGPSADYVGHGGLEEDVQ